MKKKVFSVLIAFALGSSLLLGACAAPAPTPAPAPAPAPPEVALLGWGLASEELGSISGQVSYVGPKTGTIYVLAVESRYRRDLRDIQTEAFPHQSERVYSYVSLDSPGPYTLAVEDGTYILWAWMDVNGDGGVNYLNYAEPTGWHQTPEVLGLVRVSVSGEEAVTGIDIKLLSPTPYPDEDLEVIGDDGGGTLKTMKGYKVLHLWGTPEARGYAYGYLVGQQIVDWIEYVLLEDFVGSVAKYEEGAIPFVGTHFSQNEEYYPEIDAMLAGMSDGGADMHIDLLGRDITRTDIEAENCYWLIWQMSSYDKYEEWLSCSGAAVWGDWTQNAELKGGLIHGKNMDGECDLRKVTVNSLLIIATEPAAGSGLKKMIGYDWPGFFGTFNGMNEDGLILTPHAASSEPAWHCEDMLGYPALYREALQRGSTIADVEEIWEELASCAGLCGTGGFLTGIYSAYHEGQDDFPAAIYETDSYGGVMRDPDELPPSDPWTILVTNTYFKYTGTGIEGKEAITTRRGITTGNWRYRNMLETLEQFRREGKGKGKGEGQFRKMIGTPEMIEILRSASHGTTEYSFIGYPNKMAFAVAREDLANKVLDATYAEFTEFTFGEVFR